MKQSEACGKHRFKLKALFDLGSMVAGFQATGLFKLVCAERSSLKTNSTWHSVSALILTLELKSPKEG